MKTKGVILGLLVALTCAPLAFAESAQDVAKADALFYKGLAAEKQHKADSAIAYLEESLKWSQTNGSTFLALATLYSRDKHDHKRALTMIRKAIEIEPNYFDYQWEYAIILVRQKQYKRAYEVLLAAKKLSKSAADEKQLEQKLIELKAKTH